MVFKMAGDKTRSPSPPLPPDPSPWPAPAVSSSQTPQFQDPFVASPVTTGSPHPDGKRVDSRRSSVRSQQQPIGDAVNSAFHQSSITDQFTESQLAQLAQRVIPYLQQQGFALSAGSPTRPNQTHYPPPPLPQQSEPRSPASPALESIDSMSRLFTPPSLSGDYRGEWSPLSSPGPPRSEAESIDSVESARSARSAYGTHSRKSSVTPKASAPESPRESRQSSTLTERPPEVPSQDGTRRASESIAKGLPISHRESRGSDAGFEGTAKTRVHNSRQSSIIEEPTSVEKAWQPLFENGNPTERLGQFLRGIAVHLIDKYEPKRSLVVTPSKMLQFFRETKVNDEHYPWDTIFDCDKMTVSSLSNMYCALQCQHHLVQRMHRHQDDPNIPGLTPLGFQCFMTLLIQAHPDTEYKRLTNAVKHMPISNADDESDRFPKELTRRQLPAKSNLKAQQMLISSLSHESGIIGGLKNASSMPLPPPPARRGSVRQPQGQPYARSPKSSNAVPDEDLEPSTPPAALRERERKPYSAKEGTGRLYEGDDHQAPYPPADSQPSAPRGSRPNPGMPHQASYLSSSQTDPVNIAPRTQHRPSVSYNIPPPLSIPSGGYAQPSRQARDRLTPPLRNSHSRSDSFNVGNIPAQQFGSNLQPARSNPFPGQSDEDPSRYPRTQSRPPRSNTGRNDQQDDNARSDWTYSNQSRAIPVQVQVQYGSGPPPPATGAIPIPRSGQPSGPPAGPLLGTSAPPRDYSLRRPNLPGSGDNRRRSTYSVPPANFGGGGNGGGNGGNDGNGGNGSNDGNGGNGGTDGYGPYSNGKNGRYPHPHHYGESSRQ